MAIALTLEELLGPSLREAREEVMAHYTTPAALRSHEQEALQLPKVQEFRLSFEHYIERAEQLAEQLAGDQGIIINAFQQKNTEVRHAWQVSAVCYHTGHNVPDVVAIASMPTEETEGFTNPQEAIRQRKFTHADLTHSYHSERIDEQGRIICREHNIPATLEVSAKVHRVVPRPKLQPREVEDRIIEDIAKIFYGNDNGHSSRKHERILKKIRMNLEVLLRAGESGIYGSIYDALEQTRHRAVTAPHIAKNANLDKLSEAFKTLIGYDALARTLTPEQLAQQLRTTRLFEVIQELATKYIPSPLVVTMQRTKGQTLVDKVTLLEHLSPVRKALVIDDIVGVQVLIHGEGLDYDPSDFRTSTPKLSPQEIEEVRAKCYRVLAVVADIPQGKTGYERMQPTRPVNGNGNGNTQGNGHKAKQRMPPDPSRPKFSYLDPVRGNGFKVDLTPYPIGRFDDYVVAPKESGYMAIHTNVGSTNAEMDGVIVEVQIKPNVIDTFEKLAESESHERYKLQRAARIRCFLDAGIISPMEWEVNKLLITPPGKTYVEPGIIAASGNSRTHANLRRLTATAAK